jgi:hypothetical protein
MNSADKIAKLTAAVVAAEAAYLAAGDAFRALVKTDRTVAQKTLLPVCTTTQLAVNRAKKALYNAEMTAKYGKPQVMTDCNTGRQYVGYDVR